MTVANSDLKRVVGLGGATLMGLGSIVGTGVFVSLGIAAGITGPSMIVALFLAGCLAVCNGLSSAQLAAAHPVSGGTYEYGYRFINPWTGYLAGWLFVCAKSASAATAAIGFGGYLLQLVSFGSLESWHLGLIATIAMVVISLFGITRSNFANTVIVSITLLTLLAFVAVFVMAGNRSGLGSEATQWTPHGSLGFLEATALLFVAYTGYGRIATLGEEIVDPVRNIPKAIVITLAVSFTLYMLVALAALMGVSAEEFSRATIEDAAPLQVIAQKLGHSSLALVLAFGAITAMLGVLLNLVMGLSRVVFAMGKRGDLPRSCARVSPATRAPDVAILVVGVVILLLVLLGNVQATWSLSAFTVLFYYAITNFAALRLPAPNRLYPRVFSWLGLVGCLGLSFWVDSRALLMGMAILGVGVLWRLIAGPKDE